MSRIIRPTQNHGIFARATLSATQVANLGGTSHVEWDTIDGDLTVSTGVGQADGKIILPGGHYYHMTAVCYIGAATAGAWTYNFYDNTNAAALTAMVGSAQTTNFAGAYSQQPSLRIGLYVPTDIEVVVRRVISSGDVNTIAFNSSFWEIQEILRG